jgi:hypothetical protein
MRKIFTPAWNQTRHPGLSLVTVLTELSVRILVASQYRINVHSCFTFAARLTVTSVKFKCENLFQRILRYTHLEKSAYALWVS